jgi:hypothetical protein
VCGPLFDSPSVVRLSDPTIDAIKSKLRKRYCTRHQLNLLAYIDRGPRFPENGWLPALNRYFAGLDGRGCQFANIFVFDCDAKALKCEWSKPVPR